MHLNSNVFDIWVFRKLADEVEYLLLHCSQLKADRYFNGGRFWQIPSGVFAEGEGVVATIDRKLAIHGIVAQSVWAAEHAYTIYNRRFEEIQIVSVFAALTTSDEIRLDPEEHAEYAWLSFDEAMQRVHYRGLKDGLRSTREYVSGPASPRPELCLMQG